MKIVTKTGIVILGLLATNAYAQGARSVSMGGVGVATAKYMQAPLHNPALLDLGKYESQAAVTFPTISFNGEDGGDLVAHVDDFQQLYEKRTDVTLDAWQQALKSLENNDLAVDAQAAVVLSIPNNTVSFALFSKANFQGLAYSDVDSRDYAPDPKDSLYSTVTGVLAGTVDVGLTLAREVATGLTVGISPKFQHIVALQYKESLATYDSSDFKADEEFKSKNVFNVDIGVLYKPNANTSIGFSAFNLIPNELNTNQPLAKTIGKYSTYSVEPQYKIGFGYVFSEQLTVAVDYDLNKSQPFSNIDYKKQFINLGTEFDINDWFAVRAGFKHSLTDDVSDQLSLGTGFKFTDNFGLDVAATGGRNNNFGGAAQLSFWF
ncbi:conjugal transfer protein TraF [Photobacterium leiognathi]|uniref:conjugal transfer protein TraF n=1 Tax=Photobacterium leiognathi TaxID=553611 RepID=UPI002981D7E3|nr:conjugal transfer protein TraF [Photobacterium leiognathi]